MSLTALNMFLLVAAGLLVMIATGSGKGMLQGYDLITTFSIVISMICVVVVSFRLWEFFNDRSKSPDQGSKRDRLLP